VELVAALRVSAVELGTGDELPALRGEALAGKDVS
jgi:hypothetical protein